MNKSISFKRKCLPYFLIAPAMVGIILFVVYPMVNLIYNSFFKVNQINPDKTKYVKFENYANMFESSAFQKALINTAIYTVFSVALILAVALALSVWLAGKKSKFNSFVQGCAFLPHVISMVSIGLIFQQMMDPDFGIFNALLRCLHLPEGTWLRSSDTVVGSIILTNIWKSAGYYTLILAAAIKSIPESIYEAAALDRAGKMKTFFRITLPMISPQIFFSVIVLTIGSFKIFDMIYIMSGGGPNNASTSLVYYIYTNVFQNFDVGRASAAGVILMAMVGLMTVVYFWGLSKKVHYQ